MNNPNEQPGIYQIINLTNGKSYIGQGKNISNRCAYHRSHLRSNKHPNKHLQAAWNKYGSQAFEFRKIVNLPLDKQLLKQAEQYWCEFLAPYGLYNQRKIVESNLGIQMPYQLRAKLSFAAKNMDPIKRAKITQARRASSRPHDEDTCQKISRANTGHVVTQETRLKISKARTGYKMSDETKNKIRLAKLKETT